MKWFSFLIFILFCCSGCDFRKREAEFKKREVALNQKERDLNLKENTLQIKEQKLEQRERNLDSTSKKDTVNVYNPAIVGYWLVKMTCTQTTCTGSAIGDTKTEQWIISSDSTTLIAKAIAGNKLVRVYNGTAIANTVELTQNTASAASEPATTMVVKLNLLNENSMTGTREITRSGDCKVVYDLQMKRQQP